ncbi:hypothetical protein TNIN_402781 [Trichonephila inaurata madagascariensis]|uniref:Uncharacterized protein n=1 Tax=Trichonephila inaurata madagascariensis TaxID=2747483 RepID=A0A8X7CNL4_9ARAC|nr:hypothetical protein TNIN_402781 [Trichonephila inaurata madagascariensis]
MPDEIFFPLQLLQLEEATSSTTLYRDHHRWGPLRLPGGRKDALRESQKRNNERLNGKSQNNSLLAATFPPLFQEK